MLDPSTARLDILGTPVTPFDSFDAVVRCARDQIAARQKTFCVAINPEKVERASRDPQLKQVLETANLRICDGVGVLLAAFLLHGRKLARCTGVDLFIELARVAAVERWKVFLLGGAADSNAGARAALMERFPGLQVVGCQDGFFTDSRAVLEQINSSGADILFVALGSPRQEFWIAEHLNRLRPPLCMGVGGSFDVLSGKVARAPLLFRRTGTEWLYRLVSQPSRIRRQLALPVFAVRVLRQKVVSRQAA
jgi:N-acetylglucosaminyldiphosphoundecaprenol N-acetyl-beta-D-mannosaminyltransferase